ncbi:MAG: bifunctional diaminohydroxyphosphoribosylaminopyrimidine deaminase/5-amino-6-(5-phosphoribosylamino)uracil reductase RibD [Desulfobacterales bacterium]|nr:bifunctional diaminohydroxyphosphoribosylaminopyrimidine deaminase/5-amino-6-(5-phosphoribosylamino)uracil reductase RibD [Desulfobacterales bacterium]
MDHQYYMRRALELAREGRGFTSPNPMVGAVVAKDGRIVGEGYHPAAGRPHAEVNALDNAGEEARNATLYVTLEPCNHTGRTPPCTERILRSGVKRVVTAMADPNPRVAGGGNAFLQAQGLAVQSGVCEKEALRLNEAFVKYICTGKPFVTVKCAATLDGRIATRTGDARWVTGSAARLHVHRLRHAVDGILVGINTVKADDPSLTTRLPADIQPDPRDPVRIILDTHLSISKNAGILRLDSEAVTLIICADIVPARTRAKIEHPGVKVVPVEAGEDGRIHLASLMARLGSENITSLLIEGGSRVIASAFAAGIVDKAMFFYAPKILGGDDGVPICQGPSCDSMADCITLADVQTRCFDDDLLVEGYVQYPDSE